MNRIPAYLRSGFQALIQNPLGETIGTFAFVLACMTILLCGPAAAIYFWMHSPERPAGPMGMMLTAERFRNTKRMNTLFWIGIIMWAASALLGWAFHLTGLAVVLLIQQPLWLAMMIADRYDLTLGVALKTTFVYIVTAPMQALPILLLGLLGTSGLAIGLIGVLFTMPIALHAALRLLADAAQNLELPAAIQRGYSR